VGEIIRIMESDGRGAPMGSRLSGALAEHLSRRLSDYLDRLSLADFIERPQIRESLARQYHGGRWRCDICGALAQRSTPAMEARR